MTTMRVAVLSVIALATLGARSKPAFQPPRLALPVACHLNEDCAVQSYVNHAPPGGVDDYMCRGRTYGQHNGTDFRIRSLAEMNQGVAVLASAPGRVLRIRDGLPDASVAEVGSKAIANQECGNGVVIDDGHGFETQYCHMRRGSIRVRPGRVVRAGTPLGLVGLSGDTEFPHLHFTLRQDRRVVDPFAYGATPGSCGGGRSLWRDRIAYRSGQPFVWGFADRAVTMEMAQATGADQRPVPTRDGAGLVAFMQAIGLKAGDIQTFLIVGPDANIVVQTTAAPLDHDKAQTIFSVGRKTPPGGWAPGVYQANYAVRRDGADVIARTFRVEL